MCLVLAHKNRPAPYPKKQKFYKMYEVIDLAALIVGGVYQGKSFALRKGLEVISNRTGGTKLSLWEENDLTISAGLHFFLKPEMAFRYCGSGYRKKILVEFTCDNKDLIGRGTSKSGTHKDTAVFTKATINRIVAITTENAYSFRAVITKEQKTIAPEVLAVFKKNQVYV